MKCPKCGAIDDKVVDSRASQDGNTIRRRRECLKCSYRFTTFEEVLHEELRVIKSDGRHESFSRQKLYNGIMTACQKRPISSEQIDNLIDDILDAVSKLDTTDVKTSIIGELVMERLEKLDSIAYVRFASVYRRFADVGEFQSAINQMKGKTDEPSQN